MAWWRHEIFSLLTTTKLTRRNHRIQSQPFLFCHSRRLWMQHLYMTRHFFTAAASLNFHHQSVFTMEYLTPMLVFSTPVRIS
ncbi:hypothetical protein C8J56DRAFT_1030659 [Mycena floridula]|nr:hypothetical protein C8J56DRAFT_1030659 [Mycena floridula]